MRCESMYCGLLLMVMTPLRFIPSDGAGICTFGQAEYFKGMTCITCKPQTFAMGKADGCVVCDDGEDSEAGSEKCVPVDTCVARDFPSADGTCHVDLKPLSGSVHQVQRRVVGPVYKDGKGEVDVSSAPSAKLVSDEICMQKADTGNVKNANLLLIFWGQFLDHDIGLTATSEGDDRMDIITTAGGTMNFDRSLYVIKDEGASRDYQTLNTAWIDLTNIYGDTVERANLLRRKDGSGKMRTRTIFGKEFLPLEADINAAERRYQRLQREGPLDPADLSDPYNYIPPTPHCGGRCGEFEIGDDADQAIFAGDERGGENAILTGLTTIFVREHNRLAQVYKDAHPQASEEEIFNNARLINIATYQKICWEEFLPLIVGHESMKEWAGKFEYDPEVDPTIDLHFTTASYRFGHSGIGNTLPLVDRLGFARGEELLQESFFTASKIHRTRESLGELLNGLRIKQHERIDAQIVDGLRQHLFGDFDLAALNMQRGRDHGLGNINQLRKVFDLPPYENFMQLTGGSIDEPDSESTKLALKLMAVYGEDVQRCDLWLAGICEKRYKDSQLGETFTRSIIDQFSRLRTADKFWYEYLLMKGWTDIISPGGLAGVISRCESYTLSDVVVTNTPVFVVPEVVRNGGKRADDLVYALGNLGSSL